MKKNKNFLQNFLVGKSKTIANNEKNEDYFLFLKSLENNFYEIKEPFWFKMLVNNTEADLLINLDNREISQQQKYAPYGFITLCFTDDLIFSILKEKKNLSEIMFLVETKSKLAKPKNDEMILQEIYLNVLKIQEI